MQHPLIDDIFEEFLQYDSVFNEILDQAEKEKNESKMRIPYLEMLELEENENNELNESVRHEQVDERSKPTAGDEECVDDDVPSVEEMRLANKLHKCCNAFKIERSERLRSSAKYLLELGKIYLDYAVTEDRGQRFVKDSKPEVQNKKRSKLFRESKTQQNLNFVKGAALLVGAIVRFEKIKEPEYIQIATSELCRLHRQIMKVDHVKGHRNVDILTFTEEIKRTLELYRQNIDVELETIAQLQEANREDFAQDDAGMRDSKMSNICEQYTVYYLDIMAKVAEKCEMGKPPCKYSIIGLRSLARKEVTLYSDFEHAILLEDGLGDYTEATEYFRWFSTIFQVIIIGLGETVIPSIGVRSLNDFNSSDERKNWFRDEYTPCGVSFDWMMPHACKNPLGRQEPTKYRSHTVERIQPVSKMVNLLTKEEEDKNGYFLSDILSKVCLVFGSQEIYDVYLPKACDLLERRTQEEIAEQQLSIIDGNQNSIVRYPDSAPLDLISEGKIKTSSYRPLTTLLSCAAALHSLSSKSSFEIVDEMERLGIIDNQMCCKPISAVATAMEIRVRTYLQAGNQRTTVTTMELEEQVGKERLMNCYFSLNMLRNLLAETIAQLQEANREDFAQDDAGMRDSKMSNICEQYTVYYLDIMAKVAEKCEMGKPPCKYSIIGLRSLARKEVTLYSDFEHAILLEDGLGDYTEATEYFRWFSTIFQVIIIGLGETVIPSIGVRSLNDFNSSDERKNWFRDEYTPCGVSFDWMMPHACKNPLGRQEPTKYRSHTVERIQPVSKMVNLLTKEEEDKNGYFLSDILSKVCLVFGSQEIYDVYLPKACDLLERRTQEEIAEQQLSIIDGNQNSIVRYPDSAPLDLISEGKIKTSSYRPLTTLLSCAAALHSLSSKSSFEIVDEMERLGIIDNQMCCKPISAVATAMEIRVRTYLQAGNQRTTVTTMELEEQVGKERLMNCYFSLNMLRNLLAETIAQLQEENREDFAQDDAGMRDSKVRNICEQCTEFYLDIMARVAEKCESIMGKLPCKFSIIGLGSLARKEVTLYSDYEHAILLGDELGDYTEAPCKSFALKGQFSEHTFRKVGRFLSELGADYLNFNQCELTKQKSKVFCNNLEKGESRKEEREEKLAKLYIAGEGGIKPCTYRRFASTVGKTHVQTLVLDGNEMIDEKFGEFSKGADAGNVKIEDAEKYRLEDNLKGITVAARNDIESLANNGQKATQNKKSDAIPEKPTEIIERIEEHQNSTGTDWQIVGDCKQTHHTNKVRNWLYAGDLLHRTALLRGNFDLEKMKKIICYRIAKLHGKNWTAYVTNVMGVQAGKLRLIKSIAGSPSKRFKTETLKYWRQKNESTANGFELAKIIMDFKGWHGEPRFENIPFKKICQGAIEMIDDDSWLQFVRLQLKLSENEIKKLRIKYSGFTQEQKYQIVRRWMMREEKIHGKSDGMSKD